MNYQSPKLNKKWKKNKDHKQLRDNKKKNK